MPVNKTLFPQGDVGFEGSEPRRESLDTFEDVCKRRLSRRSLFKGAAAFAPLFAVAGAAPEQAKAQGAPGQLNFPAVAGNALDSITVPQDYHSYSVLSWGDPVAPGAPAFDILNQTPEAQRQQAGYNCDYLGWFDLPFGGILTVNHEYTNPEMMFANYDPDAATELINAVEQAAHGVSVVQLRSIRTAQGLRWEVVPNSRLNRRLHSETEFLITGPAAGHPLMKTSYDGTGAIVRGTLNNCGGGITPWGTLLVAEENFDQYFANRGALPDGLAKDSMARFGTPASGGSRPWYKTHSRFDIALEPNEPNRFGWVVEIDPYDPDWQPRKRTAVGRFKHEAAATTLSKNKNAVVYSGDDSRFEYVYKFVSAGTLAQADRDANKTLLDEGTLYVARFNDDGTGEWLPLIQGENGLTAVNGFASQAEVMLFARQAADILGATQMDRPEDIEIHPRNGNVYIALTNNTRRTAEQVDAANPRANNAAGHIIELRELGGDNAATEFNWDIFMLCGDPADAATETYFAGFDPTKVSPIANPDNLAFDRAGNLWIATDGMPNVISGHNDGIFAVPVEGPERGFLRQFLSSVVGCETSSLIFNTAENALFVSIQHPGEGGTFEAPESHFPDGGAPRPTVIAVSRTRAPWKIGQA
ncbi:MAG: PhoX family phosphatase [Bryobacterales bacterium]|nr:PhoX family phosphatase [Acidobacteriota bacterium]MCB9385265.1 PhoX family phosphatase [Bryobacterales bacterium]